MQRLTAHLGRIVIAGLALGCLAVPALSDAAAPAATNDNYLSSWIIPDAGLIPRFRPVTEVTRTVTEDTAGTTTQGDLFNPDKAGHPLGGGGAEPTTCAGVRFGSTVWFDLHPNEPVGVQLVASGYPSAVAVYQYNARTAQLDRKSVFCRVANSVTNTFTLPEELSKGQSYTVQVGGLRNGAAFFSGSLNLTINLFPDHDGDQVSDGIDKCPFLAGTLGGCPPALHPAAHFNYATTGSSLRLTGLLVDQIPGGARARKLLEVRRQPDSAGRRARDLGHAATVCRGHDAPRLAAGHRGHQGARARQGPQARAIQIRSDRRLPDLHREGGQARVLELSLP